jgi:asparagine N-glycosylation enzyme membrane subunit Stt3
MADSTSKIHWKILIALSLVHFSGDFYSSFINPLSPLFMDKMGLAFGTGGILAPIVGKLGDIFTIQSVLIVLVCIPVLSLIPIYLIPEVGNHTDEQS